MSGRVSSLAVGELDRPGVVPGGCDAGVGGAVPASSVCPPPTAGTEAGTMIAAWRVRPGVTVAGARPWTVGTVTADRGLIRVTSVDGRRCLRVPPATPLRVVAS